MKSKRSFPKEKADKCVWNNRKYDFLRIWSYLKSRRLNYTLINRALNRTLLRTFNTLFAFSVFLARYLMHNGRAGLQEVHERRRYSTFNDRLCPIVHDFKGYNYAHLCHARISLGFVRSRELSSARSRRFSIRLVVFHPLPRRSLLSLRPCAIVHQRSGWKLIKTRAPIAET